MKWKNKGHEFDRVIENFCQEGQGFYLWGAGETGRRFLSENKDEMDIKGFIDSDASLWGTVTGSMKIFSPEVLHDDRNAKVIVTIFTPNFRKDVEEYLEREKYIRYETYIVGYDLTYIKSFYLQKVFRVYQYDLMVTDACTLRCEKCISQIPFIKKRGPRSFDEIKKELRQLFSVVDVVDNFHIVGGEPLLYPQLKELCQYLYEEYKEHIGIVSVVSNATILLSHELLDAMKRYRVHFTMSLYENSSAFHLKQRVSENAGLLLQYSIPYDIRDQIVWYDFQGNNESGHDAIKRTFDTCPCRGKTFYLWDGWFHLCAVEAMRVYGQLKECDDRNALSLEEVQENNVLLLEFFLGFCELGFLTECKTCTGKDFIMDRLIPAAKQMEAGR